MSAAAAVQAAAKIIGGISASEVGRYNAKVANRNALQALSDGASEAAFARDQARMALGEKAAAMAEGGFEVGSGSALDALHQAGVNSVLDQMEIRRRSIATSRGYQTEAANQRAAARSALVGGYFGAGSTMLAAKDYGGGGG